MVAQKTMISSPEITVPVGIAISLGMLPPLLAGPIAIYGHMRPEQREVRQQRELNEVILAVLISLSSLGLAVAIVLRAVDLAGAVEIGGVG
jgi:hypothetical protein